MALPGFSLPRCWEGIVAVRVLLTDLPVDAVNQEFAFLIYGDFTGGQACLFL